MRALLGFVHGDDAFPVGGAVVEAVGAAEVDEVEDVFLEAGAAEAGAGLEELGADAAVHAEDAGDLGDVGAGGLAEGGEGVDGGDALGEHGVGGELGHLAGPDVGGEDAAAGDPGGVDVDEGLDGGLAAAVLRAADEDAVGLEQVADGGAFGEELGVGEDGEGMLGVGVEHGGHGVGRAHGEGGFLHDDLVAVGLLGDGARGGLPVLQVGGVAGAFAEGLGRRVHAHEDDVAGLDGPGDVGGEEEVLAAAGLDDLVKAGLVDGQVVGVPGVDAGLVDVHHHDLTVRVLLGDDGHGRPADVPGADASNVTIHGNLLEAKGCAGYGADCCGKPRRGSNATR